MTGHYFLYFWRIIFLQEIRAEGLWA